MEKKMKQGGKQLEVELRAFGLFLNGKTEKKEVDSEVLDSSGSKNSGKKKKSNTKRRKQAKKKVHPDRQIWVDNT